MRLSPLTTMPVTITKATTIMTPKPMITPVMTIPGTTISTGPF
jgi:hypothetical protein